MDDQVVAIYCLCDDLLREPFPLHNRIPPIATVSTSLAPRLAPAGSSIVPYSAPSPTRAPARGTPEPDAISAPGVLEEV